jgi:hypothetical protein
MSDRLPGVGECQTGRDEAGSPRRAAMIALVPLGLAAATATFLLGMGSALAICPCGDGICGGNACFPAETPRSCSADCGPPPPPPPLPPAEVTVRVTVVPFGDPGRFNLHIDNTTFATNKGDGGSTGPHTLTGGPHTLSVTAGAGTDLADYRTAICGACSMNGAIQPGVRQSCSITGLRLPSPGPAPGCATACATGLLQCGAAGEPPEFCSDVFNRCLNRCQIPSAGRMSIARFASPGMSSTRLTEIDADRILADMSDVLRAFDGGDDIDCNVAFCRDGNIEDYAIDDGVIDNEAELHAVAALPQDVKVAKGIFFCGAFGAFAGCRVGGSFIVRDRPQDAVNWAHEYGHVRGLEHRDPDDPLALMTNGTRPISRRVDSRECTAYRSGPSSTAIEIPTASLSAAAATNEPSSDIRDFVRRFFIHGIPYEEAMRYGPEAVPTLLDMLADPKEELASQNIVIVLGMLGDRRAVTPLISLIEQSPEGELGDFRYEAKRNAILGLGYLVNRSGNGRALSYLRDGLDPSFWAARGITWTSPEHGTTAERDRELSRVAVVGLALSGDPSAEEALAGLLTSAPTPAARRFRQEMSGLIWEALRANRRIADEGLATYYREALP